MAVLQKPDHWDERAEIPQPPGKQIRFLAEPPNESGRGDQDDHADAGKCHARDSRRSLRKGIENGQAPGKYF